MASLKVMGERDNLNLEATKALIAGGKDAPKTFTDALKFVMNNVLKDGATEVNPSRLLAAIRRVLTAWRICSFCWAS